jgi:hypothetical protein
LGLAVERIRRWEVLGEPRVARLLQETLAEEKHADAKLTEIAEGEVNDKAAEEWDQVTEGVLEQTAVFAGRAVGIGARTIKRAASAVSFGRYPRRSAPAVGGEATSSLNRAVEMASETAHECGGSSCVASARSHKEKSTTLAKAHDRAEVADLQSAREEAYAAVKGQVMRPVCVGFRD